MSAMAALIPGASNVQGCEGQGKATHRGQWPILRLETPQEALPPPMTATGSSAPGRPGMWFPLLFHSHFLHWPLSAPELPLLDPANSKPVFTDPNLLRLEGLKGCKRRVSHPKTWDSSDPNTWNSFSCQQTLWKPLPAHRAQGLTRD